MRPLVGLLRAGRSEFAHKCAPWTLARTRQHCRLAQHAWRRWSRDGFDCLRHAEAGDVSRRRSARATRSVTREAARNQTAADSAGTLSNTAVDRKGSGNKKRTRGDHAMATKRRGGETITMPSAPEKAAPEPVTQAQQHDGG